VIHELQQTVIGDHLAVTGNVIYSNSINGVDIDSIYIKDVFVIAGGYFLEITRKAKTDKRFWDNLQTEVKEYFISDIDY
jgi:hypothetical protein